MCLHLPQPPLHVRTFVTTHAPHTCTYHSYHHSTRNMIHLTQTQRTQNSHTGFPITWHCSHPSAATSVVLSACALTAPFSVRNAELFYPTAQAVTSASASAAHVATSTAAGTHTQTHTTGTTQLTHTRKHIAQSQDMHDHIP